MADDREMQSTKMLISLYYDFLCYFNVDCSAYHLDIVVLRDISKRYWLDVERLHKFHNMKLIDSHKIGGYLTYWICKPRPISASGEDIYKVNAETPLFINELFALYVALGRMNYHFTASGSSTQILLNNSFIKSFVYDLKYRITTGDNLSMMYYLLENQK